VGQNAPPSILVCPMTAAPDVADPGPMPVASDEVVYIVEDDRSVLESLALLLSSNDILTETYATAEDFLNAFPDLMSGCVLTDLRLPGRSGMDLLHHLTHPKRAVSVIVMTGHGDIPLAVEAMKRGADDFLEKPIDGDRLLAAIRSGFSRIHDHEESQAVAIDRLHRLTSREREVFDGLVAGKPNKVIAFELNLSARTVEFHRANLMKKMGAGSLSKLVRLMILATS
jgi:two-component system, LuxR family, response regulator FixJ